MMQSVCSYSPEDFKPTLVVVTKSKSSHWCLFTAKQTYFNEENNSTFSIKSSQTNSGLQAASFPENHAATEENVFINMTNTLDTTITSVFCQIIPVDDITVFRRQRIQINTTSFVTRTSN